MSRSVSHGGVTVEPTLGWGGGYRSWLLAAPPLPTLEGGTNLPHIAQFAKLSGSCLTI